MKSQKMNDEQLRDLFESECKKVGYYGTLERDEIGGYKNTIECAMYAGFRLGRDSVKREEQKS